MTEVEIKREIQESLGAFESAPMAQAATRLLKTLGYESEKRLSLSPNSAEAFLRSFGQERPVNAEEAKIDDWKSVDLLFQITDDEVAASGQLKFDSSGSFNGALIRSYLFFAIELKEEHYTRTELAGITREINRLFPMPAMVLFRHGATVTLAVINRRLNKRDEAKDVLEKVTLVRDVRLSNPHRAHVEILFELSLAALQVKYQVTNFVQLHEAWRKTLDTSELNRRFFQELANWYFWALGAVKFPKDAPKDSEGQDSQSIIRLITRLVFCWFLKEKNLLPDELFDQAKVGGMLVDNGPKQSSYYKAVLQNLFFATLNQEMGKRQFRSEKQHFMAHGLYRYQSMLRRPDQFVALLSAVPFMNGGLFECLDKVEGSSAKPHCVRVDGFSDRDDVQLKVPNDLFFGPERLVDLSGAYNESRYRKARVSGLIHILNRYKFTIAENTPIEEEVALDPELLGKVFENLLAAFDPETGATARTQTGSFYTPREIVDYMVDDALVATLCNKLNIGVLEEASIEPRLRRLFSYTDQPHEFSHDEVTALIDAVDELKILDPACGSGAFPMGILHKLVFVLKKLDPRNERWKARQLSEANRISDPDQREQALGDIEQAFSLNELNYGRKLYLIENCIYGVDIQAIAVQISKLRFFISLVVDQKIRPDLPNRGIRPLPNLETRFVAANSLIRLDRPEKQFLRNPDIDERESALRLVRDRHFMARTPQSKAKLREEDARLRAEIVELLKDDGWDGPTAKTIASWDPYDQNSSAEFFDPEWMFGETAGFDISLGNPPYGVGFTSEEKELLRRRYPAVADYESSGYFISRAAELLRSGGRLCFIVPNTWLVNRFAKKFRAYVLDRWQIDLICDCSGVAVFEAASVRNSIIHLIAGTASVAGQSFRLGVLSENTVVKTWHGEISALRSSLDNWISQFSAGDEKSAVLTKIQSGTVPLGERSSSSQGLIPYDKYRGHSERTIKNRIWHSDAKKDASYKKELQGRDVDRYRVDWNGETWIKYGPHLAAPRDPKFFRGKRILVREITNPRILAAYTELEYYNTPSIINVTEFKGLDPLYVLGILNSDLMSFYHMESSPKSKKGLFPKILVNDVRSLPIKVVDDKAQASVVALVKRLMGSKAGEGSAEDSKLEAEVNAMVYEIYDLAAADVKIIEAALAERTKPS